jgi:hypothetical protein
MERQASNACRQKMMADVLVGSFAANSAGPFVHKCPLCINTDRKFWALGFVAMCHKRL